MWLYLCNSQRLVKTGFTAIFQRINKERNKEVCFLLITCFFLEAVHLHDSSPLLLLSNCYDLALIYEEKTKNNSRNFCGEGERPLIRWKILTLAEQLGNSPTLLKNLFIEWAESGAEWSAEFLLCEEELYPSSWSFFNVYRYR